MDEFVSVMQPIEGAQGLPNSYSRSKDHYNILEAASLCWPRE